MKVCCVLPVVIVVVAAVGLAAAGTDQAPPSDFEQLVAWMTGSFSSAAQAGEDPEFFDIRLHMARVWKGRDDGVWLYVEQAVAESPDAPYRQRVYRVRELAPELFESRVYSFEDPSPWVGAWALDEPLAGVGPEDLRDREGCAILMRRRGDAFMGGTLGRLCQSRLRGAAYATSEVEITADQMVSWDRGFDDSGTQVWGSESGGYLFRRIEHDPAEPGVPTMHPAAVPEPAPEPDAAAVP